MKNSQRRTSWSQLEGIFESHRRKSHRHKYICLKRVVSRNIWDPGKLSLDSSLAGDFDVTFGHPILCISTMFYVISLLKPSLDPPWLCMKSSVWNPGLSASCPQRSLSDFSDSSLRSLVKAVSIQAECHSSFLSLPTKLVYISTWLPVHQKGDFKTHCGDFLGGPVAKTPHSQCRGPRFNPWSGNWSHVSQRRSKILCASTETWRNQINI